MPAAPPINRIALPAANGLRAAIRLASGREVCFVCTLDSQGVIQTARVVARGSVDQVLALPGIANRGDMLVHNHPSGDLSPSDADMAVASRLHDDGVGFGIIDNTAANLYVVVEVPKDQSYAELDLESIDADLGAHGAIASRHERYEDRAGQRAMAVRIGRTFNDGGVALLEAGTGVGKSLAYLVPALRWSAANNERTIVSTNTINLQEQLVGKDLPFLQRALSDQKVRFALLKGWRNYLCLSRLEQARMSGVSLFEDGTEADLDAITAWADRTADGSLSDLPIAPKPEVWDEVVAEPDLCQRMKCKFWDRCFVFKARRIAASSDVIVVNHHLLMSDLAIRRATGNWGDAAVLPAYARLIVDEGHHLEDAAAAHLGASVSNRGMQRLFNRLERRGKGLLPTLTGHLMKTSDNLLSKASLDQLHNRLHPAVERARGRTAALFELVGTVMTGESTLRLTDDFALHPVWKGGLSVALEDVIADLDIIFDSLRIIRERMEAADRQDDVALSLIAEVRAVSRRLTGAGDALAETLNPPPGNGSVRWLEVKGRDQGVTAASVPLDLAPMLRDDLFARAKTTIVTSATLATDPEFAFLRKRLGLAGQLEPYTEIFPSPFRFDRQALLAIPDDLPAPNVDAPAHSRAVARLATDLVEAANGGVFILFTSHREVRAAAASMRAAGLDRKWPLLVHGEEQRDGLLARFRESGRAVLLGTSSFWEGVDVPGDALRGLLIAKLPFRVPTEPITAARCEAIEMNGGDAFTEYMIPHASLRLKQGFGRLIRSATDRGVVLIADSRIVTRPYGKGLVDALPPAQRFIAPVAEVVAKVRTFYAARESALGGPL
jgi:ATP-dependent DNA helicase DinG